MISAFYYFLAASAKVLFRKGRLNFISNKIWNFSNISYCKSCGESNLCEKTVKLQITTAKFILNFSFALHTSSDDSSLWINLFCLKKERSNQKTTNNQSRILSKVIFGLVTNLYQDLYAKQSLHKTVKFGNFKQLGCFMFD